MILFFFSAALLVIAALALLLPVFFHRAELAEPNRTDINIGIAKAQARELRQRLESGEIGADDYEAEKTRLEAGLARDMEKEEQSVSSEQKGRWLLYPLAASVPVAAGALYLALGTPQALDPAARASAPVAAQVQSPQTPPDMQVIIGRIKQQLEEQPDDARGWFMLGRAHLTLGEYPQAEAALRKSLEIDGSNVDVKIRLADAIALTQGGSLAGEPGVILESALQDQPDHPQGLWLYGMSLNEAGQQAAAIKTWQRLLTQLQSDPQATAEVEQLIANANAQLPASQQLSQQQQTAQPDNGASADTESASALEVQVDVVADLVADLPADTSVFIYAKAASGPPMPLAVVKRSLADLPLVVTLSDAQAMIDSMKLSAFDEVIVGARVARTGNPIAQSGDFFIETDPVDARQQNGPLQLSISETVP